MALDFRWACFEVLSVAFGLKIFICFGDWSYASFDVPFSWFRIRLVSVFRSGGYRMCWLHVSWSFLLTFLGFVWRWLSVWLECFPDSKFFGRSFRNWFGFHWCLKCFRFEFALWLFSLVSRWPCQWTGFCVVVGLSSSSSSCCQVAGYGRWPIKYVQCWSMFPLKYFGDE